MTRAEKFKLITACLSGSVLEWFDFAVYGYLAPILATLFFPSTHKLASILLTYSVFAIGFLLRPVGAMLYGHIGDRYGRRTALFLSCIGMTIPTVMMGLLPTYATIGIAAPLLVILCRMCQGLSVGGEFTGSMVYLVEKGTPGKKGFFSCWADVGSYLGMTLGSICVALLNYCLMPEAMSSYGWRLPFLSGILLAVVAVYIRLKLTESNELKITDKIQKPPLPLKELLAKFPKQLFFSTVLCGINSLGFWLLVVYIPNQTVLLGKFPATQIYLINSIVLFVLAIATFSAASLCDYFDKSKIYLFGATACLLLGYPIFYALNHFSLSNQLIAMSLFAIALGCCMGARPLTMAEIFPTTIRFTAIAMALNLANAVLGGMAPLFATYLVAKTGLIEAPASLIMIGAIMTLLAIYNLQKMSCISIKLQHI